MTDDEIIFLPTKEGDLAAYLVTCLRAFSVQKSVAGKRRASRVAVPASPGLKLEICRAGMLDPYPDLR